MSAGRSPLLLDVDTGVDDAMAIALALELERHELVAVTTVAGNVPVEYTTPNTLRVLDWLGSEVPVYRGMSAPLAQPLITAGHVHGDDGIGGWVVPDARRSIETETAPEAIVRLARAHGEEIVFAFVGPLTNLAVALLLEPDLPQLVSRLVVMGGAFYNSGNTTAEAEFNIYVDPDAAALVAAAGFRATWIGLDVTHQTPLTRDVWEGLAGAEGPASVLVREVARPAFQVRGREGVHLHDPLAVAVVEHPELVETQKGEVTIDVGPRHRGRTRLSAGSNGKGNVAARVDVNNFSERFGWLLKD